MLAALLVWQMYSPQERITYLWPSWDGASLLYQEVDELIDWDRVWQAENRRGELAEQLNAISGQEADVDAVTPVVGRRDMWFISLTRRLDTTDRLVVTAESGRFRTEVLTTTDANEIDYSGIDEADSHGNFYGEASWFKGQLVAYGTYDDWSNVWFYGFEAWQPTERGWRMVQYKTESEGYGLGGQIDRKTGNFVAEYGHRQWPDAIPASHAGPSLRRQVHWIYDGKEIAVQWGDIQPTPTQTVDEIKKAFDAGDEKEMRRWCASDRVFRQIEKIDLTHAYFTIEGGEFEDYTTMKMQPDREEEEVYRLDFVKRGGKYLVKAIQLKAKS